MSENTNNPLNNNFTQNDGSQEQNSYAPYNPPYNGTQPGQTENPYYNYYNNTAPQPKPKKKKEKKPRKPIGKKGFAAILLSAALVLGVVGGALGASIANYASVGRSEAVLYKSSEPPVSSDDDYEGADSSAFNAAQVAAKTKDSVVEIKTETVARDSFFQNYITSGAGSGVVISKDGYIVTNNHVIEDASKINVTFTSNEDKSYTAALVGTDEATDIAVLKIEPSQGMELTPAVLGNSDKLVVGESVLAIGNPLGELGGTVTQGIVSALGRQLTVENQSMTLLQIDASISPGNSGGGLFNSRGELVGIVNAKSSGTSVEGLGFAIPINTASDTIEDIMNYGYVKGRAQIGVTTVEVADIQTAYMYGVSELGVYIYSVNSGSGAEKAGLQSGDRIVKIGNREIKSYSDLSAYLQKKSVGDKVSLTSSRKGEQKTVSVTLQEATPKTTSNDKANNKS